MGDKVHIKKVIVKQDRSMLISIFFEYVIPVLENN